MGYVLKP